MIHHKIMLQEILELQVLLTQTDVMQDIQTEQEMLIYQPITTPHWYTFFQLETQTEAIVDTVQVINGEM